MSQGSGIYHKGADGDLFSKFIYLRSIINLNLFIPNDLGLLNLDFCSKAYFKLTENVDSGYEVDVIYTYLQSATDKILYE